LCEKSAGNQKFFAKSSQVVLDTSRRLEVDLESLWYQVGSDFQTKIDPVSNYVYVCLHVNIYIVPFVGVALWHSVVCIYFRLCPGDKAQRGGAGVSPESAYDPKSRDFDDSVQRQLLT